MQVIATTETLRQKRRSVKEPSEVPTSLKRNVSCKRGLQSTSFNDCAANTASIVRNTHKQHLPTKDTGELCELRVLLNITQKGDGFHCTPTGEPPATKPRLCMDRARSIPFAGDMDCQAVQGPTETRVRPALGGL